MMDELQVKEQMGYIDDTRFFCPYLCLGICKMFMHGDRGIKRERKERVNVRLSVSLLP